MAAEDLKKRIEALNKAPLRNAPESGGGDSPEILSLRRKLRRHIGEAQAAHLPARRPHVLYERVPADSHQTPVLPYESNCGPACSLEEAIDGVVVESAGGNCHYLIEKSARDLEANADLIYRRFLSLTGYPDGTCVDRLGEACGTDAINPKKVLFLDLETTGLGTTPVFLVGTMECSDGGFVFRQHLARDYSEEASIVAAVSGRLAESDLVVTFNGKSFDMPFLRNRAAATGVALGEPNAHLDLLHTARRVYKGQLPDCRLQTLEHIICGRQREDDIPGSEIPAAYHEFVRTGNAAKISAILMHNLYDLLTMADLMHHVWRNE